MNSDVIREWPERRFLRVLRAAALIAVLAGAAGSVGLMFYAGRHQRSLILIGLFTNLGVSLRSWASSGPMSSRSVGRLSPERRSTV